MTASQPSNVYREQLSSARCDEAMCSTNPGHGSIGDVGYLRDGDFIRIFNVTLPWNHPSNTNLRIPMKFQFLQCDVFVNESSQTEYLSDHVSRVENVDMGQMYICRAGYRGAVLLLPHGGHRQDVIDTRVVEEYVRDNVGSWFDWSKENGLPVERVEDLVIVTGCILASSWTRASFDNLNTPVDASITLHTQKLAHGGVQFFWSNIRGNVEYRNSHQCPVCSRGYSVFLNGYRGWRGLSHELRRHRGRASNYKDDDDDSDGNIHGRQVNGERSTMTWFKFRDMLIVMLNYIVEKSFKCDKDAIAKDLRAIARQVIEDMETLTADAILRFVHEKQMPLLIENLNGDMCSCTCTRYARWLNAGFDSCNPT
ncbi:hypothetical protein BJV77DRAFT_551285 [Russula vinacea]|nr:hypothetical protein BJV77DRAFT_551285 [Russula vinacea]